MNDGSKGTSDTVPFFCIAADERGFALVSVLFVAILIALLTSTLLVAVRAVATDSSLFSSQVIARFATEAGLNRTIFAFFRLGDPLRESLIPDGRHVKWEFHGRSLLLRAQAESGKLDLNAAERDHIVELLRRVLPDPKVRSNTISNIDAFRSTGNRMTSVAMALLPRDRLLGRLEAMSENLTVHTNQRGFDPMRAPSLVLETAPGLTEETRGLISVARQQHLPLPTGSVPTSVTRGFVSERPIYTFHAETSSGFTRAMAMSAIVGFTDRGRISIYAWSPHSPSQSP